MDRSAIDTAVALAEAETGVRGGSIPIRVCVSRTKETIRRWTPKEERFIRENLGKLLEEDIATYLRRTVSGVHVHISREMRVPFPSRDPRVLTGEHVSMGIGKDGKSVHYLMDTGKMPSRRLPTRGRTIRVVDRIVFLRWMLNPMHWCYFRPLRVGTMPWRGLRGYGNVYDHAFWEQARKAIRKVHRSWKDQWLTTGQVSRKLKVSIHNINQAIRHGHLKATRFANWWVLRSDLPKTGTFDATGKWVPRILSRSERGKLNTKMYWDDVRAGRKPMPVRIAHNKKVRERDRFFGLIGKMDATEASKVLRVSNTTCYKWLKERYGKNWQNRFSWSREARKARFFALLKNKCTVRQAAVGARVHVESCYKWLKKEWGCDWKKKVPRRTT